MKVIQNVINVIHPYKHKGDWVFDDERVDLDKEPFVAGADVLIDLAVEKARLLDPENGFKLTFSATPFKNAQFTLELEGPETGGHTYYCKQLEQEAWLCPALLRYFDKAPHTLFCRVDNKS